MKYEKRSIYNTQGSLFENIYKIDLKEPNFPQDK